MLKSDQVPTSNVREATDEESFEEEKKGRKQGSQPRVHINHQAFCSLAADFVQDEQSAFRGVDLWLGHPIEVFKIRELQQIRRSRR